MFVWSYIIFSRTKHNLSLHSSCNKGMLLHRYSYERLNFSLPFLQSLPWSVQITILFFCNDFHLQNISVAYIFSTRWIYLIFTNKVIKRITFKDIRIRCCKNFYISENEATLKPAIRAINYLRRAFEYSNWGKP